MRRPTTIRGELTHLLIRLLILNAVPALLLGWEVALTCVAIYALAIIAIAPRQRANPLAATPVPPGT